MSWMFGILFECSHKSTRAISNTFGHFSFSLARLLLFLFDARMQATFGHLILKDMTQFYQCKPKVTSLSLIQ